jgi:hypothetical protein
MYCGFTNSIDASKLKYYGPALILLISVFLIGTGLACDIYEKGKYPFYIGISGLGLLFIIAIVWTKSFFGKKNNIQSNIEMVPPSPQSITVTSKVSNRV